MLSTEKRGISRSLYIISTFLHENAKNIKRTREIDKYNQCAVKSTEVNTM